MPLRFVTDRSIDPGLDYGHAGELGAQVGKAYSRQCDVAAFQRPSRSTAHLVQRPEDDVEHDVIVEKRWCREVWCAVRSVAMWCVWDRVDKAEWGWFPTKHGSFLAIYAGQWAARGE
jgi:hypothetical protein